MSKGKHEKDFFSVSDEMQKRYDVQDVQAAQKGYDVQIEDGGNTVLKSAGTVQEEALQGGGGVAVKKQNVVIRFFKYLFPWKGDSGKEVVRKIFFLIATIILIICAVAIGERIYQRILSDRNQGNLADKIDDSLKWDDLAGLYPGIEFPEGMNPKWANLYATNQDFVGWLSIEGTKISFPIVKDTNKNEFYLTRDFNKKDTQYGNPFLDYRNEIRPMSKNTIIYGHHMRDKQIFSSLLDYREIAHFQKSPIIKFESLFEEYNFKIYGGMLTNGYAHQDNNYMFEFNIPDFSDLGVFMDFKAELQKRIEYTTGVDIAQDDKLITLSTCAYVFDDARYVLIGRMVREGESVEVDTSQARRLSNPRYPQQHYSQNGGQNPFKDDKNWYMPDSAR